MAISDKVINGLKITSYVLIALLLLYTVLIILLVCTYMLQLNSEEPPKELILKVNTIFLSYMGYILGGFGGCVVLTAVFVSTAFSLQNKKEKEEEQALLEDK